MFSMGSQVTVSKGAELFNKNIGGCKVERLSTTAEACPVLVCERQVQLS